MKAERFESREQSVCYRPYRPVGRRPERPEGPDPQSAIAGIPNPLFAAPNAVMLYGDGQKIVLDVVTAVKKLPPEVEV